jgi:chaperonin GroES
VIRPLSNRVYIKRTPPKTVTDGGLIIPEIAQEVMAEGKVVAVGEGQPQEDGSMRPPDVAIDDHVFFYKHGGTGLTIDDEDLLVLREDDIFGIINKKSVLFDFVLIKPDTAPAQSRVLWTPTNDEKPRSRTGRIVAMGKGMKVEGRGTVRYKTRVYPWKGPVDEGGYNRYPMPPVKPGDRVLYLTWAENEVVLAGKKHHLVRDTAIEAAYIEDEAAE